jgi:hypothetical protein
MSLIAFEGPSWRPVSRKLETLIVASVPLHSCVNHWNAVGSVEGSCIGPQLVNVANYIVRRFRLQVSLPRDILHRF